MNDEHGHDPVWSPSLRRYVCDICNKPMPDPQGLMAEVRLSIEQVDAYVRELHQVAAAMVAAGLPAGAVDGIADELQDLATEAIREEAGLNE